MMQTTDIAPMPSENAAEHAGKPPEKKPAKRRWLKGIVWALVLAVLLLCGFVAWLASTESGLRFGLYRLPAWFGVNITSKTLQGTLLKGFHGDEWRIETEGADVDISSFVLRWQPQESWQKKLHIQRIAAGDVHITSKPVPPQEPTPSSGLPKSVSLPLAVAVDSVEAGRITSGKEQTLLLRRIQLAYQYNHQQHLLNVQDLQTPLERVGRPHHARPANAVCAQRRFRQHRRARRHQRGKPLAFERQPARCGRAHPSFRQRHQPQCRNHAAPVC